MMTEPASATCPFCEKHGLPILPLRYAVARTDFERMRPAWRALDLPPGSGGGVTEIELPAESAKYTTRLLRPGYLYVFNEARGEWKAYLVTKLGYLYEFDIENVTPPDADAIEFRCFRTGEEFVARCITIPDAQNSTRIWLGFSPTAWTADVLARHRKQAYRERHMRAIDVQQWISGNHSQPHTAEFDRLSTVVNEFARAGFERKANPPQPTSRQVRDPETGELQIVTELPTYEVWTYPTFGFSPHEFHGFEHEAEGLIAWADKVTDGLGVSAMLVILDDPAAITMEVGALMGVRLNEFIAQESLQRPLAISALVSSLEEAIRNNAELAEIRSAKDRAVWKAHPWNHPFYIGARDGRIELIKHHEGRLRSDSAYKDQWEAKLETARQQAADGLTDDHLEEAAEKAWRKYKSKLRPGEPDGWLKTVYQPRLEAYDQRILVPLAHAHQAWMRSPATLASFECNHDDADAESGAGYVQSLLLCIQDTQQNKVCFDNYEEWLAANARDPANLLQNALLHNQREAIEAISRAVPRAGLTKKSLHKVEWSKLIQLYRESLSHVSEGGQNLVAQLLVAVGGPVMRVLNDTIDHIVGRTLVAMGVIANAPIISVAHAGTVDQAMDVMVRLMKQVNPDALGDVDTDLLKKRLEIRSRGKREVVQGRGPDGRFAAGEVRVRVDRFAIGQLEGTGTVAERADRAALAVLKMDEWPESGIARFRGMFGSNARLAVIGLIFEVVAANRMASELDEAMAHRRVESTWRFRSSIVAIVGGVGQLLYEGVSNGAKVGSVRLAQMASSTWVAWLGRVGKGLGVVAAGTIAVFDGINGVQEANKGNWGMAALYLLSAGAGLGAALLFSGVLGATVLGLSASGIGLVLVAIGIAIAFLIELFKSNELQEWMERCFFGSISEGERYENIEEELGQFELAMENLAKNNGERGSEEESFEGAVAEGA